MYPFRHKSKYFNFPRDTKLKDTSDCNVFRKAIYDCTNVVTTFNLQFCWKKVIKSLSKVERAKQILVAVV